MIPLPQTSLALLGPIGWPELLILGFLGLLIFGKRLPALGKGMGQFITNLKRGLKGHGDATDEAVAETPRLESKA
ncbi:MAG: twin-arginine translocase TatA/TatE family subunit [Phycisphaeraceae bacterium]